MTRSSFGAKTGEVLTAEDLFDTLGREQEVTKRKISVEKNSVLEELLLRHNAVVSLWESGIPRGPKLENILYKLAYNHANNVDAQTIEYFASALLPTCAKPHVVCTGAFISALINRSSDEEFKVQTHAYSDPLPYLGMRLIKSLHVTGDTTYGGHGLAGGTMHVRGDGGEDVGFEMKAGTIHIHGDLLWECGRNMQGGHIRIDGDCGSQLGGGMNGGRIDVKGNGGIHVGKYQKGGEIHIQGDCFVEIGSAQQTGGRIYQRGKLIMENGKNYGEK